MATVSLISFIIRSSFLCSALSLSAGETFR